MVKDKYGMEIGKRLTCQRCGNQVFLPQTGYTSIEAASANRHSDLDLFEPIPDGWKLQKDFGGWLCPQCMREFDNLIEMFKQKIEVYIEEKPGIWTSM